MKTRFLLLSIVLVGAVACTDKLVDSLQWEEGVMATLPEFEMEDVTGTRVSFTGGLSNFAWTNGDRIGVCRSSTSANGTAAFTLLEGGSRVGNFINDSFSLLPQSEYCAFYPFVAGTTSTSFSLNMANQTQTGKSSVDHIGNFNYMYAKFTSDDTGKGSFTFSNIGTIIQLHFIADEEDYYKSLTITSSGTPFTMSANYNLSTETLTPSSTKATLQVSFVDEGLHVYYGEDVVVTAVILPVDMSQSTLTFQLRNANGVVKEMALPGYAFQSGKVYHFYEHTGNPPYGSCPDGNHPHAIDLGLPSGTLWACMDIGANSPAEMGFSWFSWGEADLIEKNSYTWADYMFMDPSYSNEYGITKYQIPDNLTDGVWYSGETFIGDNKTKLDLRDDAARALWGGQWRIPPKEAWEELASYTRAATTGHTHVGPYSSLIEYDYNGWGGVYGTIFYKKKVMSNPNYSLWDTHLFIRNDVLREVNYYTPYRQSWHWAADLGSTTPKAYVANTRNGANTGVYMEERNRVDKLRIRPVRSKPASE